MKVDGSAGITADQVKSINAGGRWIKDIAGIFGIAPGKKGQTCVAGGARECQWFFDIIYVSNTGSMSLATFRFVSTPARDIFRTDLEAWIGEPLRTVGPSIKITQ